jgi:hypothetical protein
MATRLWRWEPGPRPEAMRSLDHAIIFRVPFLTRNPKFEAAKFESSLKVECNMIFPPNGKGGSEIPRRPPAIRFSGFGFISDFELRNSGLTSRVQRLSSTWR